MNPPRFPERTQPPIPFPEIRVTLERMRAQLIQVFCSHPEEYQATLRAQIDAAFAAFDFEREVRLVAGQVIQEQVRKIVSEAIREAFRGEIVQVRVQEMITAALRSALDRDRGDLS